MPLQSRPLLGFRCLKANVWSGDIGGVRINWPENAQRLLYRNAIALGMDLATLKAITEHIAFAYAKRRGCCEVFM
ncbi:hypothetical protein BJX70DRAFT_360557, partial [Aspergillus crustosus]